MILLALGAGVGAALWYSRRASAADSSPRGSSSFRYASWHDHYAPMVGGPADAKILSSGCTPDANGNIQCDPETMRAGAEKQLKASSFWPQDKPLDLATYTLARYMHSEIGSGRAEERVAVGEAARNRAHLQNTDVNGILLYRQPNHLYGQINVPGKGNINGRWAATSRDPSILTTLLADLVMSGRSEDITHGADDQDGLEFKKYFPVPMDRILSEAKAGRYWVGPVPGIDHWKTTLFRTFGYKPDSTEGKALIERARAVFGNPVYDGGVVAKSMRPVWPAKLDAPAPSPAPAPAQTTRPSGAPLVHVNGERVLVFGDSLSHPGADAGPVVTDVRATDTSLAISSAPGAVMAARLLAGLDTNGQRAEAVRINAKVGRSARSFMLNENFANLIAGDASFRPTKVIVMLGTNDIDRGVGTSALELTKDSMRKIRDAYRAMGAEVVAIGPPSYKNGHYTEGAPAILAAMREVFGQVLDPQSLTTDVSRTPDGIHFTQAGGATFGKRLAQAVT